MVERRQNPRYPAHWRVVVVCDCQHREDHQSLQGVTGDVSSGGATVFTKHNFCARKDIVLLLDIPPEHAGGKTTRLQIQARTTYTVLSGERNLFRSGIQFLNMSTRDRETLNRHLENRFGAFPIGSDSGTVLPLPK